MSEVNAPAIVSFVEEKRAFLSKFGLGSYEAQVLQIDPAKEACTHVRAGVQLFNERNFIEACQQFEQARSKLECGLQTMCDYAALCACQALSAWFRADLDSEQRMDICRELMSECSCIWAEHGDVEGLARQYHLLAIIFLLSGCRKRASVYFWAACSAFRQIDTPANNPVISQFQNDWEFCCRICNLSNSSA